MSDNQDMIKKAITRTIGSSAWESLNDRQRIFVLEYIRTMNATAAYSTAYSTIKKDVARAAGARLLANVNISTVIEQKLNALWLEREEMCGRTLAELMTIAYSNISNVIKYENGKISLCDLNQIDSRAIKCIKHSITENGENFSITMHDKNAALGLLAKILGMVQDRVDHTGTITVIPAVRPSRGEE